MYRLLHKSNLPKFIKILLYILLTITCVYWICIFTYKLLDIIRIVINYISDKRNWWTFIICIVICLVIAFIFAQFVFNLNPIGKIGLFFQNAWISFENWIKKIIQ